MELKTNFLTITMLVLIVVLGLVAAVNTQLPEQHGPRIDKLRFLVFKSPDAQSLAMQRGDIDVLTDLVRPVDVETLHSDGFPIVETQGFEVCYFGFNVRVDQSYRARPEVGPVLSDVNFRHGLAHLAPNATTIGDLFEYIATDHKAMIPLAMGEWCNPNVDPHPFNPGDPLAATVYPDDHSTCGILRYGGYIYDVGLNNWVTPYDLDGDAIPGTTDGTITDPDDVVPILGVFTPTFEVLPTLWALGAIWVADMNAVGLTSIVQEPTELWAYLEMVFGYADFDMYITFWRPDRLPHHLFDLLHSSQDCLVNPWRRNAPGVLWPELDAELETLMFSLDHDEKMSATKKVQEMIANGSDYCGIPYIPLYTRKYLDAFQPGLEGVRNSYGYGLNNQWMFLNMRWAPGHPNERIEDGDTVLHWCLHDEPERLNPCCARTKHAWEILNRICDPLIAINPYTHQGLLWLATDLQVVETLGGPGAMNVTFWLNPAVEWQDGTAYTAEDAMFNWLFLKDNQIPRYASMWENIQDVEVITPGAGGVVRVILSETSQWLLYDLAETVALLPPPVWSWLYGRPLDEILGYDPSTNTTTPTGAGPRFGTPDCPTQLYGTGPFVFQFSLAWGGAEMLANRYYFKATAEIEDQLAEMFHYMGDINYDGIVSIDDVIIMEDAMGTDDYRETEDGDIYWEDDGPYMEDAHVSAGDVRIHTKYDPDPYPDGSIVEEGDTDICTALPVDHWPTGGGYAFNPDADITGPECTPDGSIDDYDASRMGENFGSNGLGGAPPPPCYLLLLPLYPLLPPTPPIGGWRYSLQSFYVWGLYGSSPAIANVRDDIEGLEVALGSDEYINYYPELGGSANGIWRLLDSTGGLIWAKATQSDESRSSPAVADLNGNGYLEIVGGTTSGSTVEAIDRFGNFTWTFPHPPSIGNFMWPSSPAVADVDPAVSGLEVIIGNRPLGSVWAFDGDNTDGINDGITVDAIKYPWATGTEGVDWDVLWIFQAQASIWSTPAIGDVDNDGQLEVVLGTDDGVVYALDGATGVLKWSYPTGSAVRSSAALADLDDDPALEVVLGSLNGKIYCLDGSTSFQQWNYQTGGAVNSSPAIYSTTIFIGSTDGKVYSLNATGSVNWRHATGYPIYSSPAIANRGGNIGIYIGSGDLYSYSGALFILNAADGSVIDIFGTASIHTSPSVADIDGDHKLEIIFYDWAGNFWCLEDTTSQAAAYGLEWPMFRCNAKRMGWMTILGDFDYDGEVDRDDLALLAGAYGSSIGQPAYNPEYDINRDGVVDVNDLAIISKNYGENL